MSGSIRSTSLHASQNSHSSSRNQNVGPPLPTQEEIVQLFYDQMVEFIIDDFLILYEETTEGDNSVMPDEELLTTTSSKIKSNTNGKLNSFNGDHDEQTKSRSGSKLRVKDNISIASVKKSKTSRSTNKAQGSILFPARSGSDKLVSHSKPSSLTHSSSIDEFSEEILNLDQVVRIVFKNGNVYEGRVYNKVMEGYGKYQWTDGTIYEGYFRKGYPSGLGEVTLPDLSHYKGHFDNGLFHGQGVLNIVSTQSFYSGHFKHGKKHGQGWFMYEPDNFYDGEWADDMKDGKGLRKYKNGDTYRGEWSHNKRHGRGFMIWNNNDFYRGAWAEGLMDGYGEYIWRAFCNDTFVFPKQTSFKGDWVAGKRTGEGTMLFGTSSGAKLIGFWERDFKQGDGYLIYGNGRSIRHNPLFEVDKIYSSANASNVPIFATAEAVNIQFYVDKVIQHLENVDSETMTFLTEYEQECVRNTITMYLPQLKALYDKYATLATKEEIQFEPTLPRMFLWQFYRDINIKKFGLSLIETDNILLENPDNCLKSRHYPFEKIYFWQFLMSLVGTSLATHPLETTIDNSESPLGGVCAFIIKKFFDETVFATSLVAEAEQPNLAVRYIHLVPLTAAYGLYKELGEPHSAKCFLKHTCPKRGQELPCYMERNVDERPILEFGKNIVPLVETVVYIDSGIEITPEDSASQWKSLNDFRHLGPRNIVRCLANVCPLIMKEGVVVDMDYPLTFLEFYEVVLGCIFNGLQIELKKEKDKLTTELMIADKSKTTVKRSSTVKPRHSRQALNKSVSIGGDKTMSALKLEKPSKRKISN